MKTEQLFIPDKIKVGFQQREDTYTGKLAYVIYFDKKGVLRKETSWESWRNKEINALEFDNTPIEGFVLNKGVGGARESYGWNARNEYIRVYDPRDFEFEISVANLLFILRECDCSRGKGLEGKFVYAWDKNNLVLLPVVSQDYQVSASFTNLQDKSVKAKDLVPGATYITRKQEILIYLGRFMKYSHQKTGYQREVDKAKKQYVFWSGKDFVFFNEPKTIAVRQGDAIAPNFAELVDKYNKSFYNSKAVELFTKKRRGKQGYWAVKEGDGYRTYQSQYGWSYETQKRNSEIEYIQCQQHISIDADGNIVFKPNYHTIYCPGSPNASYYNGGKKWIEPTNDCLWVRLESGDEYEVGYNQLIVNNENEENDNGEDED